MSNGVPYLRLVKAMSAVMYEKALELGVDEQTARVIGRSTKAAGVAWWRDHGENALADRLLVFETEKGALGYLAKDVGRLRRERDTLLVELSTATGRSLSELNNLFIEETGTGLSGGFGIGIGERRILEDAA